MQVGRINTSVNNDLENVVKVKKCGNIVEVICNNQKAKGGSVKKLNDDYYIDVKSGEVKAFEKISSREDFKIGVARSLQLGRDIINTNVTDVSKCRWLTLTYAENMTDTKKLQKDFENFVSACRKKYGKFEYITCAEPQGRGAWHTHSILIFDKKAPFMSNDDVYNLWAKKGFVSIKKLDNVDNVGVYLTAYLGDMSLTDCKKNGIKYQKSDLKDIEIDGKSKKYVKGARLSMYPPKFHIFRYSKGIKKTTVYECTYQQALNDLQDFNKTFEKTLFLKDDKTDFKNVITYEYFKKEVIK